MSAATRDRREKRSGPSSNGRKGNLSPPSELDVLLGVLPDDLKKAVYAIADADLERDLLEIVLDLGRQPEARLITRGIAFADRVVRPEDLAHVQGRIGDFTEDNRSGIERTLHRIAAMRNRKGHVVALTLRVGRAIPGSIDILRDFLESERNLLLLGRPGVGKTTKLREIARILADGFGRRVIVVDTSNEIGGDGDVPHPAIGGARRMQVPRPELQHRIMIEAVENHMPEVIVIDEIGTVAEAAAARTIAERGVQLVGTAHGTTLENLVLNPTISDLVGGTHTVTLSDDEARRRRTAKTITERRGPATFDVVVEMVDRNEVVVYPDAATAVDQLLEGRPPDMEKRRQTSPGEIECEPMTAQKRKTAPTFPALKPHLTATLSGSPGKRPSQRGVRVYSYGLNEKIVLRALEELEVEADMVGSAEQADVVVALRERRADRWLRELVDSVTPTSVYFVKREKTSLIRDVLRRALLRHRSIEPEELAEAMQEAEHAIDRAIHEGVPISLSPRGARLRRMQHQVISRHKLHSESTGSEPSRHLVVYPARVRSSREQEQLM